MLGSLEIDAEDVWEALEAMPHYSPPPTPSSKKRAAWQVTSEGDGALASCDHSVLANRSASPARSPRRLDLPSLPTEEDSRSSIGLSAISADVITPSRPTHDNSYVGLFLRTRQTGDKIDVGNSSAAWDPPSAGVPPSTSDVEHFEIQNYPESLTAQVFSRDFETTLLADLDALRRDSPFLGDSFPSSASPGRVSRARRCRSDVRNARRSPHGRNEQRYGHARHSSTSMRPEFTQRQRNATQASPPLGHRRRRLHREVDEEIGDEGLRDYLLSVLRAVEEAPGLRQDDGSPIEVRQLPPRAWEVEAAMQALDTFVASDNLPDACVICLEEMGPSQSIARLDCRHCFHLTCIQCWLPASLTCPLCKQPAHSCE